MHSIVLCGNTLSSGLCMMTLVMVAMMFCLPAVIRGKFSNPVRDTIQHQLQQEATKVLQEVVRGPLHGHRMTLLMDDDVEEVIRVDSLLVACDTVIHVIRTGAGGSGKFDLGLKASAHSKTFREKEAVVDDMDETISDQNPTVTGTMVSVINGKVPWPLEEPPVTWSSSALLLIQVNLECDSRRLLQTQLAERTPAVVLLCPVNSDQENSFVFRLLTWLPYDPPGQQLLQFGVWDSRVFPSFSDLFYDRFRSLAGRTLHVASDDDDAPLVFLDDDDEFEGTSKRILDLLSVWLNFTYTLTHGAPDSKWGEMENGTWVGLLGEVYRGNKDLTINYFTITHERSQYFDYSVSFHTEGFGFALPMPPEVPRWRNLIYPFTWVVWAAVGGLLIVTSSAFYTLASLQPLDHVTHPSYTIACIMKGLVNQSQNKLPRPWSLRLFLAAWWLTAYVIIISYTCNLIAVLTVPVFPTRIQTLQQLAHSDFRLCMLDYGEFVPDALASSSDAVMRSLGGKMDLVSVTDEGFYGQEDCGALVLDGKNAHTETYAYLRITYSDMGMSDKVYFMREQIYEGNLAFFFRKHTPWVPSLNKGIRFLTESGFVQHWQKNLMEEFDKSKDQEGKESTLRPLTLAHLQGAFFVLAMGLLSGFLAFLLEYKLGDVTSVYGPADTTNKHSTILTLRIIFNPST
ncbi:probable glutamate receptor [Panulirus ornatus]|uniref:probable glutamate receptor n=1 Tax=Panulirus ornatus TaxID=150431 RepID=UPI003A8483E5